MLFISDPRLHSAAQRISSPAADYSKTTDPKTAFSTKWPPRTRAESGQVQPMLGCDPYVFFF